MNEIVFDNNCIKGVNTEINADKAEAIKMMILSFNIVWKSNVIGYDAYNDICAVIVNPTRKPMKMPIKQLDKINTVAS